MSGQKLWSSPWGSQPWRRWSNAEVDKPTLPRYWNSMEREWSLLWNQLHIPMPWSSMAHIRELSRLSSSWMTTLWTLKLVGACPKCTGEAIPLRSTSGYLLPANPWPKAEEVLSKKTAFAFTKRKKYWYRPEQGNNWDEYGDSSLGACVAAFDEEPLRVEEEHTARVRETRLGPMASEFCE